MTLPVLVLTQDEMTSIANEILLASEFNYTAYLHFHAYMRKLLVDAQTKALEAAMAAEKEESK